MLMGRLCARVKEKEHRPETLYHLMISADIFCLRMLHHVLPDVPFETLWILFELLLGCIFPCCCWDVFSPRCRMELSGMCSLAGWPVGYGKLTLDLPLMRMDCIETSSKPDVEVCASERIPLVRQACWPAACRFLPDCRVPSALHGKFFSRCHDAAWRNRPFCQCS